VSIVIAFVTFNFVVQGRKWVVVSINRPMNTSSLDVHMVILVFIVRASTSTSHIIISSIRFAICFLVTKILAKKTITKKEILIPGCDGSS
jgi:hypothetical protein